jgi:glutathione S-transferase
VNKVPVYSNPYDAVDRDALSRLKLHYFGVADPVAARLVPTLSPFSAKLAAYLRFQKIPYESVYEMGVDNAPRRKVPFISVDGVKIADSDLIIGFLKTITPDPDAALSASQRAIGHLVQRALEDHLYWVVLYYEFYDDAGREAFFKAGFGGFLPAFQPLVDDFADRMYEQGTGRYLPDEVIEKAKKDLAAVAEVLGDNRYLLGTDKPTSFDAAVFGMTVIMFQIRDMHPEITDYFRSLPKLRAYIENLLREFFPELESAAKALEVESAT